MSQKERRRSLRRPILSTFSVFVVVPKKGIHRLQVHDLSDLGIGFDMDTEGEDPATFPVKVGDTHEVQFYLNQSLYLPLTLRVVRVEEGTGTRRVGAEFAQQSKGYEAIKSFVQMLDRLADVGQMV